MSVKNTFQSARSRAEMAGDRVDQNGIVQTVRLVGGAMISILLVTLVLNEVFQSVNVGSGPFSGIAEQLTTTGVSAMGLLIVGLLVVAARRITTVFGGGGGM